MSRQLDIYRDTFRRRSQKQARPGYVPPAKGGFREEAEMAAFCQSLEVERSSSAGIAQFQTLEKRAQTEILMGELEPTLTLRRNETARLRAIARGKRQAAQAGEVPQARGRAESNERKEDSLQGPLGSYAPVPTGYAINTEAVLQLHRRARDGLAAGRLGAAESMVQLDSSSSSSILPTAPTLVTPPNLEAIRLIRPQRVGTLRVNEQAEEEEDALADSFSDNLLSSLTTPLPSLSPQSSPSPREPQQSPRLLASSSPSMSVVRKDDELSPPTRMLVRGMSIRELLEKQRSDEAKQDREEKMAAPRVLVASEERLTDRRERRSKKANASLPKQRVAPDRDRSTPTPPRRDAPSIPIERQPLWSTLQAQPTEPKQQQVLLQSFEVKMAGSEIQQTQILAPTPATTPESAPGRPLHPSELGEYVQRQPSPTSEPSGGRQSGSDGFRQRLMQLKQRRLSQQISRQTSVDNLNLTRPGSRDTHPAEVQDEASGQDAQEAKKREELRKVLTNARLLLGGQQLSGPLQPPSPQQQAPPADDDSNDSYSDDDNDRPHSALLTKPTGECEDWSWSSSDIEEDEERALSEQSDDGDDDDGDNTGYSDHEEPAKQGQVSPLIASLSLSSSAVSNSPGATDADSPKQGDSTEPLVRRATMSTLQRKPPQPALLRPVATPESKDASDDDAKSPSLSPRDRLFQLKQLGSDVRKLAPAAVPRPQRKPAAPPVPSLRSDDVAPMPLSQVIEKAMSMPVQAREPLPPPRAHEPALPLPALASALQLQTTPLESHSLMLSPDDAAALAAAVEAVVQQQQQQQQQSQVANDNKEDDLWAIATRAENEDWLPSMSSSASSLNNSQVSSTSSTPYHTRTSKSFRLSASSGYLRADESAEQEAPISPDTPTPNSQHQERLHNELQRSDHDVKTAARDETEMVGRAQRGSQNGTSQATANNGNSPVVRSSSSSRLISSAPRSNDLRQLIVHVDENDGAAGGRVVLLTLRSMATTLSELKAKIQAKFPNQGQVLSLGVWMSSADGTPVNRNSGGGWLIPIETDDDVEELIHGNVLRARFEH